MLRRSDMRLACGPRTVLWPIATGRSRAVRPALPPQQTRSLALALTVTRSPCRSNLALCLCRRIPCSGQWTVPEDQDAALSAMYRDQSILPLSLSWMMLAVRGVLLRFPHTAQNAFPPTCRTV